MNGVRQSTAAWWALGRWIVLLMAAALLSGCASTSEPETGSHRSGSTLDRVSPVRAAETNTRLGIGYFNR
ncbi:MAG: hypothetical protein ACPGJE_09195, partial [Wenzhouxiangellaceae bacterium]